MFDLDASLHEKEKKIEAQLASTSAVEKKIADLQSECKDKGIPLEKDLAASRRSNALDVSKTELRKRTKNALSFVNQRDEVKYHVGNYSGVESPLHVVSSAVKRAFSSSVPLPTAFVLMGISQIPAIGMLIQTANHASVLRRTIRLLTS